MPMNPGHIHPLCTSRKPVSKLCREAGPWFVMKRFGGSQSAVSRSVTAFIFIFIRRKLVAVFRQSGVQRLTERFYPQNVLQDGNQCNVMADSKQTISSTN